MKKKMTMLAATAIFTAAMATTAYAGWEQDGTAWKYKNEDGSYSASCWQWIDGNQDGAAESYYFDGNGYLLVNTTTPDGYMVNGDGAWVENGVVQVQQTAADSGVKGQYDGVYAMISWDNMPCGNVIVETLSDTAVKLKYEDGTEQVLTYSESETQYYEYPTYTYEPDENSDDIPWRITFETKDLFWDKAANSYTRVQ